MTLWYRRGKFWYRTPRGPAAPHEVRTCANPDCAQLFFARRHRASETQGRFCSVSCSMTGENHPRFAGDDVGYTGAHRRVYLVRGKATRCVFGCSGSSSYQWANLTGSLADPGDYAEMCARCHSRFDAAVRAMAKNGPWRMRTSLPGGLGARHA